MQLYHRAVNGCGPTLRIDGSLCGPNRGTPNVGDARNSTVRSFVSPRTQRGISVQLEENTPRKAIQAINRGLETLRRIFPSNMRPKSISEEDEIDRRLVELRRVVADGILGRTNAA